MYFFCCQKWTSFTQRLAKTKPGSMAEVEEICENDPYAVRHKIAEFYKTPHE